MRCLLKLCEHHTHAFISSNSAQEYASFRTDEQQVNKEIEQLLASLHDDFNAAQVSCSTSSFQYRSSSTRINRAPSKTTVETYTQNGTSLCKRQSVHCRALRSSSTVRNALRRLEQRMADRSSHILHLLCAQRSLTLSIKPKRLSSTVTTTLATMHAATLDGVASSPSSHSHSVP